MNSLYHKLAIIFICNALAFTLEANKEVKAATFTFNSTSSFVATDSNRDKVADYIYGAQGSAPIGLNIGQRYDGTYYQEESRIFYDFNIANLHLGPNEVIRSAIFQTRITGVYYYDRLSLLAAYGISEQGVNMSTVFDSGDSLLYEIYLASILREKTVGLVSFSVLPFIGQRVKNNEDFARFGIRNRQVDRYADDDAFISVSGGANLTIETESVPEPTTIFGSALALGVGGWLKQKKSS
jgi:hypothetical protein